ncbi:MAG: amidophosphoribosyltransferase [Clostridia bacterium]|nr:amidophosphoribosyltransferase [Clostridia bacterium]
MKKLTKKWLRDLDSNKFQNLSNEKLNEECGVLGIYNNDRAVATVVEGLYALQHRGQESCGYAVSDGGVITGSRGAGVIQEVFTPEEVEKIPGKMAIGHVKYSGAKERGIKNAQPLIVKHQKGRLAIAVNATLTNSEKLKQDLSGKGAMFTTDTDAEIIAQIAVRKRLKSSSIEEAVLETVKKIKGCYSLVMMSPTKLIAVRDPHGFRPLCLGKLGDGFVVASETAALDTVKAEFLRDILPGEIVVIDSDGVRSLRFGKSIERAICIFEYIYFARPDSVVDGVSVHEARVQAGMLLAKQRKTKADMVIGVPDSGLDAAIGYSKESKIPYGIGFHRNSYVGRTFIKPVQKERTTAIGVKLNVIKSAVEGKRIVMVDDSIVRGSTSKNIVFALRNAGAKEVHVRISSPTIHHPCYFGTDIPTREELTSNKNSVEELCKIIGADSLEFLDPNSLGKLINSNKKTYCDACFTGNYPVEAIDDEQK